MEGSPVLSFAAHDESERAVLSDLVEIARTDLPSVASLGLVAMTSDGEVAQQMLVRVISLALEADCGYIAELAYSALGTMETQAA